MDLHLSDRHIVALNLLLVTVLAYFAALALNDIVLFRHSSDDAAPIHAGAKATDDSSGSRPRAAYQMIVERDIFNLEPPPAPPAPVVEEDLHLTLIGVSQMTKGKPYAIVADERGEQSVYRVGETIPGSGKLLQVEKDKAVVEHDGKQVVLELPKEDLNGEGAETNGGQASFEQLMQHRRMRRHFE
jgi:type II secretory pathway component PulC